MSPPAIGVVSYRLAPGRVKGWTVGGYGLPANYVDGLRRAGGRPLLILPGDDVPLAEVLDGLDGLLLIGGGDVDPARYGQEAHTANYGLDAVRDDFELALLVEADARALPTLCICRGMQVLNVAFGGTLFQHLPDEGRFLEHGQPTTGEQRLHPVTVEAGTLLAEATGARELRSSCHHHQGVDRVGEGLRVSARAADGLVEGIERDGTGWMLGVEWHPEDTAGEDGAQQGLFDALVARAGAPRP
ncbi:MAG: gamma-glutamyl-gamma-aminobutyrate hydrolase family protein [Actinomycetota bacterium]